ncbi:MULTISPECIES: hypothetical protein [Legionella]|uniref:Uncharacterized protein n=1 Tax=Legionella resiliens TaxID=2905958 RepID=A0ABS8X764_9GAMM|nr:MULTISPECIES: hypothetical protein [unclassified Legionella]MCE0724142.1 hypothetical protein [Legionella sp. 9fVS26]MCE3533295.1 hypothetical protein [Legionella sp. 8cVS16]QLZ69474.1 hypothetical protein FOLKNPGA_02267 [Legionella sp. PC1000]
MSRLKVFTNLANRMYKKVVGEKEKTTQATPEGTKDADGSYGKMESVFHTGSEKGTVKSQKSVLLDDIERIRTDFQLYNGAKNRIRLHDGGIKDSGSGYKGNEKEIMKTLAEKITAQLEQKGWTTYFEATTYHQIESLTQKDKSMPKDVRNKLIELCKEYGSDFQYFKKELQKEEFKLEEEPSTIPSFQ